MIQHANVIIQKTIALSSQLNGSLSPRRLLDPSFLFTALSDLIWRLWSWVETWLEIFSAKVHSFIQPWGISICGFFYMEKLYLVHSSLSTGRFFCWKMQHFSLSLHHHVKIKLSDFFFVDRLIKENDEALTHPICTAKKDFQSLLITQMP